MMKKIYILAFALLVSIGCTREDKGGVNKPPVDAETAKLEMVCKVWGMVKYFHPVYAQYKYFDECDIDADLLFLLAWMDGLDTEGVREMLAEWIDGLGPFESSEDTWDAYLNSDKVPSDMVQGRRLTDMDWIYNREYLGTELSEKLVQVYNGVRENQSKYAYRYVNGNGVFEEKAYAEMTDPSLEYRLLALFRYWNIIEYFYPAKYLTDTPWDEVLRECIPVFVAAEGTLEYEKAISMLTAKICDTHGVQFFRLEEKNSLPYFGFEIIDEKIYVSWIGSQLEVPHTIKVGDEVVEINGMTYQEAKKEVPQYISLSNIATINRIIKDYILLVTDKSSMPITFVSDGVKKTEEFPTMPISPQPGSSDVHSTRVSWGGLDEEYKLLNDGRVGYFNPGISANTPVAQMFADFKDTEGIVIDMRCYPTGEVMDIPYRFIDPTDRPFVRWTHPDGFFPGYSWIEECTTGEYADYIQEGTYDGRVVLVVNEYTQSYAESIIMIFQTLPNAVVVGSQTAGANGNVAYIYLPGGIRTVYSGLGVQYPDGTETQRYGVRIDREVHLTVDGIRAGKDELLDAAVDIILNGD